MRREGQSLRPPIFPGTFPVWQGFWARQAIQGAFQALVAGRGDGNSRAIPERIMGEILGMLQIRD